MPQPLARGLDRYQANIWKFYLFQFCLNFQFWWPIWVIYLQQERGLALGQVTLLDVPFWLCIALIQIPAGALADRWGRKPTLALGGLLWSGGIAFFGLAPNIPLLLVSYLVQGLAWSLLNGPDSAFLYDSLRAQARERDYQRLYGGAWAVIGLGSLAGTLAGAPIAAAADSLSFPIVLSGAIGGLAVPIALSFKEPAFRSELAPSYRAVMADAVSTFLRVPEVRYAVLFFGVTTVGLLGPFFFFQPFLIGHGVAIGDVGYWQTPMRLFGIVGALYAYRWSLALGEQRAFVLIPALLFASYALIGAWDSLGAQVAFPPMLLLTMAARPAITDYLNRRLASSQRATVVSLTSLAYALVLVPAAPALGTLSDHASPQAAYWAAAAVLAAFSLPILVLWFRLPRRLAKPVILEAPAPSQRLPGID